jgi:hypothetical protein
MTRTVFSVVFICFFALAVQAQRGMRNVMMYSDTTRLGVPFAKDPHVIRFGGRYLMYYTLPARKDKNHPIQGLGIGIAASTDLRKWTKIGEINPKAEPELNGLAAPCAIVIDNKQDSRLSPGSALSAGITLGACTAVTTAAEREAALPAVTSCTAGAGHQGVRAETAVTAGAEQQRARAAAAASPTAGSAVTTPAAGTAIAVKGEHSRVTTAAAGPTGAGELSSVAADAAVTTRAVEQDGETTGIQHGEQATRAAAAAVAAVTDRPSRLATAAAGPAAAVEKAGPASRPAGSAGRGASPALTAEAAFTQE